MSKQWGSIREKRVKTAFFEMVNHHFETHMLQWGIKFTDEVNASAFASIAQLMRPCYRVNLHGFIPNAIDRGRSLLFVVRVGYARRLMTRWRNDDDVLN
jgi:hypothetical protein